MIIGLAGPAGCGKSTVADILSLGVYGFVNISFADTLRDMAYDIDPLIHEYEDGGATIVTEHIADAVDLIGWDAAKREYPEVRRFLQRLGTEGVRNNLGQDTWVKTWHQKCIGTYGRPLVGGSPNIVAADVRFENEVRAVKDLGGFVVYVNRPGHTLSQVVSSHASEQFDPAWADAQLQNDGDLFALELKTAEMYHQLKIQLSQ